MQYCSGRACGAIIFILMSDYKSRWGTVVQRRGQYKPLNLFTTLIIPCRWIVVGAGAVFALFVQLRVSCCGRLCWREIEVCYDDGLNGFHYLLWGKCLLRVELC